MLCESLLLLVLWLLYELYNKIDKYLTSIYIRSKLKHRRELVDLYWFFGSYYGKTGFSFPRAYVTVFQVFEKTYFGFGFLGVRIFIKNTKGEYLMCLMESERQYDGIIYDIGAGGFVASCKDALLIAKEEMYEELSLKGDSYDLRYIKTVTPANGYHCIVHVYLVTCDANSIDDFRSNDGTYEGFMWIDKTSLKSLEKCVRDDPHRFITKFDYI